MREAKHYRGATGFFDTHAHLYDAKFDKEGMAPSDILNAASEAGVTRILIPADNLDTSRLAVEYRRAHNGECGVELYASVGVHPHEASSWCSEVEQEIMNFVDSFSRRERGIMALGEIGLDYYYDLSPRDVQRSVFRRQLEIAHEADIPVIIHERDATGDMLSILRQASADGILRASPGVCHCCSMSREAASEMVKMGFYIGVDGPLTFKNNKKTPEVVLNTPIDRLVIETDSPYLTPEPNRGMINGPEYVPFVAARLASLLGMSEEEICRITAENGLRMYEIGTSLTP
ncbi:TatD DNase family protein [Ruminococcaceae bacterium YRB3002]|nr:TatD DNase family protein [Ruminococcaceae bacterium YRB3002]